MEKLFVKGAHAVAEAALRAGCRGFFGYPITPQSEIGEYMSEHIWDRGGVFIQAESELASSAMVFGGAATGDRVMTSSSGPGIANMQEFISTIACSELPAVFVNMVRGGPGGGNILPSQCDYNQVVYGGGNGDYHTIVLTPFSVQELVDFTVLAFDLADKYRNPVMVLGDGQLSQMMEEAVMPPYRENTERKPWAANGDRSDGVQRERIVHFSVLLEADQLNARNDKLQKKYDEIEKNEQRSAEYNIKDDNDIVLISYGTSARICQSVIEKAEEEGISVGLFRPQAVWPFPKDRLKELAKTHKRFVCVEMSSGQMVNDVQRHLNGEAVATHYGKRGGKIHTTADILGHVKTILKEGK